VHRLAGHLHNKQTTYNYYCYSYYYYYTHLTASFPGQHGYAGARKENGFK